MRIEPVASVHLRVLRFGYMETPNVPKALAIARKLGWQFDIMSTSFFLSRRSLKPAAHSGMPRWQCKGEERGTYFQIDGGVRSDQGAV